MVCLGPRDPFDIAGPRPLAGVVGRPLNFTVMYLEETVDRLPCGCACGKAQILVLGRPFARFICHCTICQSVYRAPFADVTILFRRSVVLPQIEAIRFKKYRTPPALSRGTCTSCGSPVVALMPFPRLAFIPAPNYPQSHKLPAPAMHIFYQSRISDVHDNLPKYSGYWPSELAVTRLVLRTVFRRGPDA